MTVNGFQVQLTDNVRDVLESIKGKFIKGVGNYFWFWIFIEGK
jgi:hypothetical protein